MKKIYLFLLLTLTSLTSLAEVLTGNCGADGNNLTYTLDTKTGVLKIEGSGVMEEYGHYSSEIAQKWYGEYEESKELAPWFGDCSSIKKVELPDGLTCISSFAFYYCKNLAAITIPESVTIIGDNAFSFCTSLTSIILPDEITSIGDHAFFGCAGITSIDIPKSVTHIGEQSFADTGIDYPICFDTNFVYLPENYKGSFEIPNGITTIAKGAFWDCTGLTSITIPESVTTIDDDAFRFCI